MEIIVVYPRNVRVRHHDEGQISERLDAMR